MPLTKVDYSKTTIYKIQHLDIDELLYVGSTTDFTRRKAEHKRVCNNANGKKYNTKIYKMIRDNGGFDCFKMTIIKEFPCNNKQEALTEEDRCIREMKSNMNAIRTIIPQEEREIYTRLYYERNRNELVEKRKQYDRINKEKIAEYQLQYRQLNKDKLAQQQKQKITCECGSVILKYILSKHKRTKKHLDLLNIKMEN